VLRQEAISRTACVLMILLGLAVSVAAIRYTPIGAPSPLLRWISGRYLVIYSTLFSSRAAPTLIRIASPDFSENSSPGTTHVPVIKNTP